MPKDLGFIHSYTPPKSESMITLLLLHGTGGNEKSMISVGRMIDPNAGMLSPRGKISENGVGRFFRRFSEGVFDIEDVIFRTHELSDFVEEASREYNFDLSKVVAVGYSNGANIASTMLLLRPRVLAGAILFRPMIILVPGKLPDLSDASVLISAGLSDSIVPQDQTEKLADSLIEAGAKVVLRWQQRGHDLSADEIRYAKEWLSKSL